jgi:hypothetical protein
LSWPAELGKLDFNLSTELVELAELAELGFRGLVQLQAFFHSEWNKLLVFISIWDG